MEELTEYQLLVRCLSEQTVVEKHTRRLKTKEDGEMDSGILQNLSDPEATFRSKAGKNHSGYAANFEETVGANGSLITDYSYKPNTHSDSQFLKEHLERMEKQKEAITLITDGVYSGKDNHDLVESQNVKLVTTDLTGRDVPEIYAEFEFDEEDTRILKCPVGNAPKSSSCMKPTGQCRASFPRELCANCPNQKNCKAKIHKKSAL